MSIVHSCNVCMLGFSFIIVWTISYMTVHNNLIMLILAGEGFSSDP